MFTDAHCHLADPFFIDKIDEVIQEAINNKVNRFITTSTQTDDFKKVLSISNRKDINICFGIHPWFSSNVDNNDFDFLQQYLAQYPRSLVGEIGLDFLEKNLIKSDKQKQLKILSQQLEIAKYHKRPVILHNVRSTNELIKSIKYANFDMGGVVHGFAGSIEEAKSFIDLGFYIGIGSLLLNPGARKICKLVKEISIEDIVIETDSPFMLGKKINTPANVLEIAKLIAQEKNVSLKYISEITEKNIDTLLTF